MTNMKVSGNEAASIERTLRDSGVIDAIVLGYESLCELLTDNKPLRAQVPRLYGLGDLSEILDERAYAQAEAVLATMHDDLSRLVPVEAHRMAHAALRDQRFSLLIGPPGSGKTAIAASLAVGAIDLYGTRTVKLAHPAELNERWNPNDPHQLFWLDDVFGATQYDYRTSTEWNQAYPAMSAALQGGARMIVTSRDYVYAAARPDLKMSRYPLLEEGKVVIEVESFTREEREQILYNHLKLGNQPPEFLTQLKPEWLEEVAAHPRFLPELARRLGDPLFTKFLDPVRRERLLDFIARPEQLLLEILVNLDAGSRAAMGLVHLRGGQLGSPYVPSPGDQDLLDRVGTTLRDALRSMTALDGSLLRLVTESGSRRWEFHHPTFTDAYRIWLSGQPEMLGEYIDSTPLNDLMGSITCGDVGITGALVVPHALYGRVLNRLPVRPVIPTWNALRYWKGSLWPFLARRCDRQFLREYLTLNPDLVGDVFNIGLYLSSYTVERDFALSLLADGIATEEHRLDMVRQLSDYALNAEDGSFLNDPKWLSFFTEPELEHLDRTLEAETIPNLDDLISEELSAGGQDASIGAITDSLDGYYARFSEQFEGVFERAREQVAEHAAEYPEDPGDFWGDDSRDRQPSADEEDGERSVFEDLTA
jgi:energy-coupling factor transporter ATP-binding protein EcfA2